MKIAIDLNGGDKAPEEILKGCLDFLKHHAHDKLILCTTKDTSSELLLSEFANRIEIDFLIFVFISAGALLVAFLTVSFQAYKATGINPATALKIE